MAVAHRVYSASEAAAVSGIGVKAVHNAIDRQIVTASSAAAGSGHRTRRSLTSDDLVRLKLWCGIGTVLSSERRMRLFQEIAARPSAKTVKADDLPIVDVAEARKQVAARVRDLDEAEAAVERVKGVMGGEAVFKGTRIPVRMVAGMLWDGATQTDILEGYPTLSARMLELAKLWVLAHPGRGRPGNLARQGFTLKSREQTPFGDDPRTTSTVVVGRGGWGFSLTNACTPRWLRWPPRVVALHGT